jgi:acyl-coenzyme A synthetase/AMP-(fatty) acid ligase
MAYVVVNSETVSRKELAVELQDWVAQRIGAYKRPRWVEFLPEIPKTATGKLQRFKLRELQDRQNGTLVSSERSEPPTQS